MPNRHKKSQVEISLKPVEAEATKSNSALRFRESSQSDLKPSEIKPLRVRNPANDSTHFSTGTFKSPDNLVKKQEAHVQWYNGDQKDQELSHGNRDFAPVF